MERLSISLLPPIAWVGVLFAIPAWSAGTADPLQLGPPMGAAGSADNLDLASGEQTDLPTAVSAKRARSGEWNFSLRARGTLTLSDNVELAPPGEETADLVLGVSLPLGLRREGARVKAFLEYVPTVYFYAQNRDLDNIQNNLRSLLALEAVDDYFFVEASANIYQTYISPFASRPVSGASATQNRTQQTTLGVSPYIRHQTSRGWRYLVRNDTFWNTYTDTQLSNSVSNRFSADIESPPTRLNYALDYTYLYTRDDSQPTAYYQQVGRIRPIYRVTRKLSVSARLGYESNDYVTKYSGSVYGAGIDWTPTPRTKLDGFLEHRFFGASYRLNFTHRTRRTAWRLSGTRDAYTTVEQPLSLRPGTTAEVLDDAFRARIPDPAQREQAVRQFLERAGLPPSLTQPYSFYTNQVYRAEQWTGSVAFVGRRNTTEMTIFWQQNEPITTGGDLVPGVLAGTTPFQQQGITLTFTHRISGFSTLALVASRLYTESLDTAIPSESTQDTVRLSVTRQLSPRTDGSIGVRWVNFDSTGSSSLIGPPYDEVAVLGSLAHSF